MATVYSLVCFGGLSGKTVTFTDAGDVVNLANHGLRTGAAVFFETTVSLPIGLAASTLYYIRYGADANKFTLHPTQADADANTNQVTFTTTGVGTHKAKSSLIFTGADLSRYDSTRVYDGIASWNTDRTAAPASAFDIEVAEVGEAFSEVTAAQVLLTIPSAQNLIISKINGIRSAGWHNGNHPATTYAGLTLAMGYVMYCSAGAASGSIFKLNRYRDTIDGITVMNTSGGSVAYGVDLDVQCTLRNSFVYCTRTLAVAVNHRGAFAKSENNVFNGWQTGAAIASAQAGVLFQNNLITKCTNGFSATSTVKGFVYNNIAVGNTTNWPTQPTSLEGASNNAGLAGQAWATGGAPQITIATTDFADYANNNFYPAASTSPQVETGVQPYGFTTDDIDDHLRPDYMDGGAEVIDCGPFEYDHGFGNPPITVTFTGLVSGSTIRVFETGSQTVISSTTSSGTTYTPTGVGEETVDYTVFKDGYFPIRVTGVVLSDGLNIGVSQSVDRPFVASSGLTYGTTATINTTTKVFGLTTGSTGQNWYSFWIEQYRSNSALYNKPFPLQPNGPNSFTLRLGYEFDGSTSRNYITRDGIRYVDSSEVLTASWAALLSVGVPAGLLVRYQQTDGGATQNASAAGNIDQLIQVYGDSTHGNFDYRGYLVCKVQEQGYDQAEVNIVTQYGNLEDQLYVISLAPAANGVATGNPALSTVTITDHGASPVTWSGKTFSVTITDTGTASGTDILRWIRYAEDIGGTFQGKDAFDWHDLMQVNGDKFKGVRGAIYGDTGAALKGVRVLRGSDAHPDVTLHTADDGTTVSTTPPAQATATILANSRIQLYNVTTAAELDNSFQTGTTYANTLSAGVSVGDTLRLRVCKLGYESAEALAVWTANGAAFIISQAADAIYAAWGIDGSTITEFSGDVTGHIYIDANDLDGQTTKTRLGAWYSYVLTLDIGIRYFYGAVTALATNAIRINVDVADILIENVNASTALRFTDTDVRLYRSDGTSIIAPTSYSIHNDYSGVPDVVETGTSGLTTAESNKLMALPETADVWGYTLGPRSAGNQIKAIAASLVGESSGAGTTHITFTDGAVTVDADVPLPGEVGNRENVVIGV